MRIRLLRSLAAVTALFAVATALAPAARAAGDVEVKGKYTVIRAPAGERAMAERLAKLGDSALDLYARDLGAAVPAVPFKVFLFGAIADYEQAEAARTHGAFKGNLAYTHRDTCDILMYIQPRPGRPAAGAPGMMDALFAHELVHALCYRLFPSYDDFPNWLSEGVADAWSERALSGGDALMAERMPWYASFLLDVREALEDGRFIPLERLMTESLVGHDFAYRQLRYAECYALVRMLDSPEPENAARRAKFRAFLAEVNGWPKGPDVAKKANAKLVATLGNLVALEREYVKTVLAEKVFPWQIQTREIRAEPDGSIVAEAFPESTSLSFSNGPEVGPIVRLQAEAEVENVGSRQANLAFGYRSKGGPYYILGFGPGYVSLLRFSGKYETLKSERFDPALFAPGKHVLTADIDCGRIWAKLDGKQVLAFTLPEGIFGKGRWGIGCYDGRVAFRNAQAITPK